MLNLRLAVWVAALGCIACSSRGALTDDDVKLDRHEKPVRRSAVRAFYSGHSLTDGVPEEVQTIGASLALLQPPKPGDFDFEFQSGSGALMVVRGQGRTITQGNGGMDAEAPYRFGRNRRGEHLDVAAELLEPRSLKAGDRYNVLVITERNDLPWTSYYDETVPALRAFSDAFARGNPSGDVLLYHVWLALGDGPIEAWLDYERDALPLWECAASAVNRTLPADRTKLRVLPGATALADLVESFVRGDAPGVSGTREERLSRLFSDDVHLAPLGLYFMGLVHYAALFGVSPEGAAAPSGVAPELAAHMQRIAWQHVSRYAQRAAAGAARDMAWCRAYAAEVMCPRFYQFKKPAGGSLVDRAKHMKHAVQCGGGFENLEDPNNPFRGNG